MTYSTRYTAVLPEYFTILTLKKIIYLQMTSCAKKILQIQDLFKKIVLLQFQFSQKLTTKLYLLMRSLQPALTSLLISDQESTTTKTICGFL